MARIKIEDLKPLEEMSEEELEAARTGEMLSGHPVLRISSSHKGLCRGSRNYRSDPTLS